MVWTLAACSGDSKDGGESKDAGSDAGDPEEEDASGEADSGDGSCGNGELDPGESCDDSNLDEGDGCDATCNVESGFSCQDGSCSACGDGKLGGVEVCDDKNTETGDGCSADCLEVEAGFNCFFPGIACAACGNGVIEPGERCDEGAFADGIGCDDRCQTQDGFVCSLRGETCSKCGDGRVEALETCDDLNLANNDGCSSQCQIEAGYVCASGACLAAACGDGFRAGKEQCDDGNARSGDGCSVVCGVERGWVCVGTSCHRTVCGDTVVEGSEQCDDGNRADPGCDASCQLESGYKCPVAGAACVATVCGDGYVEGTEQCDDAGAAAAGCAANCQLEPGYACDTNGRACNGGEKNGQDCATDLGCPGGSCADLGGSCHATVCGDGIVEGTESCDDKGAQGVCRGGSEGGTSCGTDTDCAGGGACVDGCSSTCAVNPFYRCEGQPSQCKPILEFVAIRRFNISNVSPDGLVYDPLRRAFAGHKQVASQKPIELCLDGTVIDPNDTAEKAGVAYPFGTIYHTDARVEPIAASYQPPPQIFGSTVSMLEAAYDPFTGHYLFLTKAGSTVTLTDVPLCTVSGACPADAYEAGVDNLAHYQTSLNGAGDAQGLTVGEDGDLYVTDSVLEQVLVFPRRRDAALNIIVPACATTPDTNCTSFASTAVAERAFDADVGGSDVLDAIFTVPGEEMVALFHEVTGMSPYTGLDTANNTTFQTTQYFSFYEPALATDPPLYGRSALPGLLFQLGEVGRSYTKYAQSAETASDGGAFILCPQNPSEDCQLFARTCSTDADCADIVPGTSCTVGASVPYCAAPGEARDDLASAQAASTGKVIDVLANDGRSESSCLDPIRRVISVAGTGAAGTTVTTAKGGTVSVTNDGANVTYSAPSGSCGFVDSFVYTANLGGGVTDDATVRVVVECVCGDGVVDANEQCDLGGANGPLPSRCSSKCTVNVTCGDGTIDAGEACDDGNVVSGDGCSALCTLETICGDGLLEGVEACDDGNVMTGDACNANCTVPSCGDGRVDVQAPFLEACDEGSQNADTAEATCTTQCKANAQCGNGKLEPSEGCDDGNTTAGDGCDATCSWEVVLN